MTSAVTCRGLRKAFDDLVAVDSIDLEISSGEILGLLGPNGAGKTTTIRILTTLLPADSGSAAIFGFDVGTHAITVRRLIGYVPQQLSADGSLSGRENVALFARLFDVPRRDRARRTEEALDSMGLTDAADRLVSTYSGGMIRRLELAQALISEPRLLILDEPTIGLDPVAREGVWDRITGLRDTTGMTVLITTHYMDEANDTCDRVALMHHGRISALGSPGELRAAVGPNATLDDVFRLHHGHTIEDQGGDLRNVVSTRRTAHRLG
ncbi:ATP-binding cassette domain-containing protein [soil metagenome]